MLAPLPSGWKAPPGTKATPTFASDLCSSAAASTPCGSVTQENSPPSGAVRSRPGA